MFPVINAGARVRARVPVRARVRAREIQVNLESVLEKTWKY